jgi:catechol 2,3-dioxygenase-like lactoylglutathione lyase family enzyme
MLDHVSIPVADLPRAARFYDAVLATLALERRKERPGAVGYGPAARPAPVFWILEGGGAPEGVAQPGAGLHLSFQAATRRSVDAFHEAALRGGGHDAGPPGERPHYTQPFYAAFAIDLDGFKIEAVFRGDD